jgi:hypothetical protein
MTNAEYNEMTQKFMNDYTNDLANFYRANHELVYKLWKSMGFTFEIWENDKSFKLAFIAKMKIMFDKNPELFEV